MFPCFWQSSIIHDPSWFARNKKLLPVVTTTLQLDLTVRDVLSISNTAANWSSQSIPNKSKLCPIGCTKHSFPAMSTASSTETSTPSPSNNSSCILLPLSIASYKADVHSDERTLCTGNAKLLREWRCPKYKVMNVQALLPLLPPRDDWQKLAENGHCNTSETPGTEYPVRKLVGWIQAEPGACPEVGSNSGSVEPFETQMWTAVQEQRSYLAQRWTALQEQRSHLAQRWTAVQEQRTYLVQR